MGECLERRMKRALVAGLLVFLLTLGGGTQVTQDPATYLISAAIAGGVVFCMVYLGLAKISDIVHVGKRGKKRASVK